MEKKYTYVVTDMAVFLGFVMALTRKRYQFSINGANELYYIRVFLTTPEMISLEKVISKNHWEEKIYLKEKGKSNG